MAKIIYDPGALAEIREAADYYENCREGLGQTFLSTMESAIRKISPDPLRWRKISGRFWWRGSQYGVIYSAKNGEIFIAAVMHLK